MLKYKCFKKIHTFFFQLVMLFSAKLLLLNTVYPI